MVLTKFEENWLAYWKSDIEHSKKGAKTSLLKQDKKTGRISVNVDIRYSKFDLPFSNQKEVASIVREY